MLFNSIAFFVYLPIVFTIYWALSKGNLKWQNFFVVIASYVFYGWWSWKFLVLMAFTTLCSFIGGSLISSSENKKTRKIILAINVVINLGILGLYKYYNFFVDSLQGLLSPIGISLDSITLDLILPVGISFYTFQAISYTIDVYRRQIEATKDVVAFFAFISFFPQLVAGPIERATNLLPQFLNKRSFDYGQAVDGCRQILWGMFKKVVVADNCAIYVDKVFANPDEFGGINLIIAAIFFSFQIYCDFSGYSDIAIGVAKLFGIKLMRNFKTPYFSRDIAEFWRRWHISLTTWFRDYIYIPLGGSRCKKSKVIRNTFVIFLVSGLWHGASWTFVAWGAYHAFLFMPLLLGGKNRKYIGEVGEKSWLPTMGESLLMGWTFLLVMVGWIMFRADNMSVFSHYIHRMFTVWHFSGGVSREVIYWILLLLSVEWIERKRNYGLDISGHGLLRYRCARWTLYTFFVFLCFFCYTQSGEFIYFQF
ncbi:MAG: MBOAT family protein [Duncaniella sp.]|nr:MBOAT family protein [Duncaniella sp.]